jgi:hypothetical protein
MLFYQVMDLKNRLDVPHVGIHENTLLMMDIPQSLLV